MKSIRKLLSYAIQLLNAKSVQSNDYPNVVRIELCSNDPLPHARNTHEHDLVFDGEILFQAEVEWVNESIRGTNLEGEIFEGMAIYRIPATADDAKEEFVAEQFRTNWRVIVNSSLSIPFFSSAKKFSSLDGAIQWLKSGNLYNNRYLRDQLDQFIHLSACGVSPIPP